MYLLKIKGFSAQEIGEHFGMLRSNVSIELNILCRDKKIIKIINRPVLYFDREQFIKILDVTLHHDCEEIIEINDFINNTSEAIKFTYFFVKHQQ